MFKIRTQATFILIMLALVSGANAGMLPYFSGTALLHKSITGIVYIDKNNNGHRDNDETGMKAIRLTLKRRVLNSFSIDVRETETDDNGYYSFNGLWPGRYQVEVESDNQVISDNPCRTRLGLFRKNQEINFIILPAPDSSEVVVDITADPGRIESGQFSLLKWNSQNADRIEIKRDDGELLARIDPRSILDRQDSTDNSTTDIHVTGIDNSVSGSIKVFPDETISYIIMATGNNYKTVTDSVTVTVTGEKPPPPPVTTTTTFSSTDTTSSTASSSSSSGSSSSSSSGSGSSSGSSSSSSSSSSGSAGECVETDSGAVDVLPAYFSSPDDGFTHVININNAPDAAYDFSFDLLYDSSVYEFEGYAQGSCSDNLTMDCSVADAGIIHCKTPEGEEPYIHPGDTCSLISLDFIPVDMDCSQSMCPGSVSVDSLEGDMAGWSTSPGCICCPDKCIDNETRPCENQDGVCYGMHETCTASSWPGCDYSTLQDFEMIEVTCDDGLDNDCDGLKDCFDPDCSEKQECIEKENICNDGIDNDNDSYVDCEDDDCEGYSLGPCDTGMPGRCAEGQNVCSEGEVKCLPIIKPGTGIEMCDNIDNDCDGEIDEDFSLGSECWVGKGECRRVGVTVCSDNGTSTVCEGNMGEPEIERCDDGLDNDCDGLTDCNDPDCSGTVECNLKPVVTIITPADGMKYDEGHPLTFSGTAIDPEDGELSDETFLWRSNIDGVIGTGNNITKDDLSPGVHTITLFATDSVSAQGEDDITLTVAALQGEVWNFEAGDYIDYSSCAVVGGKVYFGSRDFKVYCLDASTGTRQWEFSTNGRISCSPLVFDSRLFIGSSDNSMYCLRTSDGLKLWQRTTGGKIKSSPAVSPDKTAIYFGSWDKRLYALDPGNGNIRWTFVTGSQIQSSPAVAVNGTIYFGSDDFYVYALNPAGSLKWKVMTDGCVSSSPALANGHLYVGYSGSDNDKLICLDAATGERVWEYETEQDINSSPAVAGGRVYFGSNDQKIYCLDAATGRYIWDFKTGNFVFSSPAVSDGYVYAGSQDNVVYCLSAEDGNLVWQFQTGYIVYSSPAVSGGYVYVGSGDRKVYCLRAASDDHGSWPMFRNNIQRTGN